MKLSSFLFVLTAAAAASAQSEERTHPVTSRLGRAVKRVATAIDPRTDDRTDNAISLEAIYGRAARFDDGSRNPVIVIPGILGSKLVDGDRGRVVWGAVGRDAVDPQDPAGARLIGHPLGPGVPLSRLRDRVVAAAPLERVDVNLLGVPFHVHAYGMILRTLGTGGYRDESIPTQVDYGDEHFSCFTFFYDWRRDNAETAAGLARFIESRAAYVRRVRRARFGVDTPVRFDVVAHSMGGLVARQYLRYGGGQTIPGEPVPFAGAGRIERLILVAPPNAGSTLAVDQLVNGYRAAPLFPKYDAGLLATMPSIYQLLPRPRHEAVVDADGRSLDLYNVGTWDRLGWGLLDPRESGTLAKLLPGHPPADRRVLAREHLAKCLGAAKRFHDGLDVPASPPDGTSIHLIVGDNIPTAGKLTVDRRTGRPEPVRMDPGDNTVTRPSALLDERADPSVPWRPTYVSPVRFDGVTFLAGDHLGITSSPAFSNNVLHLLLERPRD
ncbi:MAG: hypothetical protein AAGJ97_01000 [Planctomycetota bacterium]